jgi:hypothetical protein
MRRCATPDTLVRWTIGVLDDAAAARLESHAAECVRCARAAALLRAAARRVRPEAGSHIDPALLARWDRAAAGADSIEVATARVHLESCEECAGDLVRARSLNAAAAREASRAAEHRAPLSLPPVILKAADGVLEFFSAVLAAGGGARPAAVTLGSTPRALDAAAALAAVRNGERVRVALGGGTSAVVSHDIAAAALLFEDVRLPGGGPAEAALLVRSVAETVAVSDATGALRVPLTELRGDLTIHVRS